MFSFTIKYKQIALLALVAVLASLLFVSPTQAAGPTRAQLRAQNILGVLPAIGSALSKELQPMNAPGNLDYHGGPVIHANTVYLIYWAPAGHTMTTRYKWLITSFFKNVAAASGRTTNVYYSDTQYTDSLGSIKYQVTFGGAVVDTRPFPASGCTDTMTSICLTDAQLRTELKAVMSAHLWTPGINKIYFMFTPVNVGSCAGGACAYTDFCAYHSWFFNSAGKPTIYANMPYAGNVNCGQGSVPTPHGDDADLTINVASHEHNEAITDPTGMGWYDSLTNYENGDNCAWNFGTSLGSTIYGSYNQVIGLNKYYLQQEWSNYSTACVLTGK